MPVLFLNRSHYKNTHKLLNRCQRKIQLGKDFSNLSTRGQHHSDKKYLLIVTSLEEQKVVNMRLKKIC